MDAPIAPDVPLVDLHRHLDGNVRLATVLDIARQHGIRLPADNVEGLRPYAQVRGAVPSLMDFLAKFDLLKEIFVDAEAIERIAYENLEDAVAEGIDYIELRFSPAFMGERHGLAPRDVTGAICAGLRAARGRLPVQAQLIVIMSRHLGEERCWEELEAAIAYQDQSVVAVDLAGDEANFPGERFRRHFERARAAGFHITVHAGEAGSPASVRQAIEELGAERIGHAVHAIEDAAVLDLIAARGIAIESCPTSNIQTSTVPSYAAHPLPAFLRRGLMVTLASDDPGISAIDLAYEYRVARDELGLTPDELRRLQANGVAAAFLPDAERAELWRKKEQRTKNKSTRTEN
ncbi:MAG: adenosine deaminase [Roseiflexaceae bacterium]